MFDAASSRQNIEPGQENEDRTRQVWTRGTSPRHIGKGVYHLIAIHTGGDNESFSGPCRCPQNTRHSHGGCESTFRSPRHPVCGWYSNVLQWTRIALGGMSISLCSDGERRPNAHFLIFSSPYSNDHGNRIDATYCICYSHHIYGTISRFNLALVNSYFWNINHNSCRGQTW